MASAHYRQVLNLSDEALEASQRAVARIRELADRLDSPTTRGATPAMVVAADDLAVRVRNALFDDLNAPQALAAVFDFLRAANGDLDRRGNDGAALERARQSVAFIEATLGIVPAPEERGCSATKGEQRPARPPSARVQMRSLFAAGWKSGCRRGLTRARVVTSQRRMRSAMSSWRAG